MAESFSKRSKDIERMYRVFDEVQAEREAQKIQYGFPEKNDLPEWSLLLAEEFGEVMIEANEVHFKGKSTDDLKNELIQVAAVAISMLEHIKLAEEQGSTLKGVSGNAGEVV